MSNIRGSAEKLPENFCTSVLCSLAIKKRLEKFVRKAKSLYEKFVKKFV